MESKEARPNFKNSGTQSNSPQRNASSPNKLEKLTVEERLKTEEAHRARLESAALLEFSNEVRTSTDVFPTTACISASLTLLRRAMKLVAPLHSLPDTQEKSNNARESVHA